MVHEQQTQMNLVPDRSETLIDLDSKKLISSNTNETAEVIDSNNTACQSDNLKQDDSKDSTNNTIKEVHDSDSSKVIEPTKPYELTVNQNKDVTNGESPSIEVEKRCEEEPLSLRPPSPPEEPPSVIVNNTSLNAVRRNESNSPVQLNHSNAKILNSCQGPESPPTSLETNQENLIEPATTITEPLLTPESPVQGSAPTEDHLDSPQKRCQRKGDSDDIETIDKIAAMIAGCLKSTLTIREASTVYLSQQHQPLHSAFVFAPSAAPISPSGSGAYSTAHHQHLFTIYTQPLHKSVITITQGLFLFSGKLEKNLSPEVAESSTKFYLFSRKNTNLSQEINPSKIPQSLLNRHHPVRFVIHGWQGKHNQTEFIAIKDAYLKRGNFNIILVDWSFASSAKYVFLTSYIKHIGHAIGKFIKKMSTIIRMSLDNVYIIGFSMGAHIAGIAGKTLYPDKINTIFGLDAAGPIFDESDFENKLKQTDAKYVETIHTNIQDGLFPLGHAKPIGIASFYPAYGRVQPGCVVPLCSHGRSREYFTESIDPDIWFVGKKCTNFEEIKNKSCTETNDISLMGGEPSRKHRQGVYYVEVDNEKPFGRRNNY